MKAATSVSIDINVLQSAKDFSAETGITLSGVIERALAKFLEIKLPENSTDKLTAPEKDAWEAFERLLIQNEDTPLKQRIFTARDIARACGKFPSTVIRGLRGLEKRGMLTSGFYQDVKLIRFNEDTPEVEHWGERRAREDGWWKKEGVAR